MMMLTSCSDVSTKEAEQSLPPMEAEMDQVEDGQTLTVLEPKTVDNPSEEKPKYQIQTRLTDFHMLDESSGIAWGLTKTALRMYQTSDYGATWVNISPSSSIQFRDNPVYGRDVFFADPNHGWIVRNSSDSGATMLLNTTDGGREWRLSSLPNHGRVSGLSFPSPYEGWIMTADDSSQTLQVKTLYSTKDTGKSWSTIMENGDYPVSRTPGTIIPRTGKLIGLDFADSLMGYTVVQESQGSKLYVTQDGGYEWKSSAGVFQEDQLRACEEYIPGSPELLERLSDLWIPVQCENQGKTTYKGYFTNDSGDTWELASFALQSSGELRTSTPYFLSYQEGWIIIDGFVHHTNDRGRTWRKLPKDDGLTMNLERYPIIAKLQFTSSQVGWMLVESENQEKSRLLLSRDGGRSWRVR